MTRPAVYDFIIATDNVSADSALAEALAQVEPEFARLVVEAMLARNPTGAEALVGQFHRFDPELRESLAKRIEPLRQILAAASRSPDVQTRINVTAMINQAKATWMANLLLVGLTDQASQVRAAAASTLRDLADNYLCQLASNLERIGLSGSGELAADERNAAAAVGLTQHRRCLLSALQEGLTWFGVHGRPEVVEAAMWFAAPLERLLQAHLLTGGSRYLQTVSQILARQPGPRLAAFTYLALSWSELRRTAAAIVSRLPDGPMLRQMLQLGHMIDRPAVRLGLAEVRRLRWLDQDHQAILHLPQALQVAALKLACATSIEATLKLLILQDALLLGQPELQRAAIDGLIELDCPESTEVLCKVLAWDEPALAEPSLVELLRRNPPGLAVLIIQQLTSRSPRIRQIAARHAAGCGFEYYWQAFEQLSDELKLAAGQVICKLVPDLPGRLRDKLASNEPEVLLRAIRMAIVLELIEPLAAELSALAEHRDQRVRTAANDALARLSPAEPRQPEGQAAADQPACPAEQHQPAAEAADQLETHSTSPAPAIRAEAVRDLLEYRLAPATSTLAGLLEDSNPDRRLCGLSLVEQTGQLGLMARVLQLARHDPDEPVRHRAQALASTLRQALRRSQPAGPQELVP